MNIKAQIILHMKQRSITMQNALLHAHTCLKPTWEFVPKQTSIIYQIIILRNYQISSIHEALILPTLQTLR